MSESLLQVEALETHLFTKEGVLKPVNGVSFHVDRGETVGLVGESGCGKTMTALSIMGLVPNPPGRIVGGAIQLDGEDLLQLDDRTLRTRRSVQMGMIFQDASTALNPTMRVGDQIAETMQRHMGMNAAEAALHATEILDRVGIPAAEQRLSDYPHQFSGGMRQRVMIAIAICCNPELLIADEPTTALDVTIQAQLLDLIRELKEDVGKSVLWITHDLGVVAELCDRVMVMYAGQVVEEATVEELFLRPRHPYTAGLLDSMPTLEERRQESLKTIEGMPPNMARMPSGCAFHPRCEYASERCVEEMPVLERSGREGLVACWHPLNIEE
ncbi:MAG: ABC transporter ATP-binding protein [Caldilineaceae bacterium]|nr:ABC transporter ATP-binding protein [Caldilineaceae bacterium]MDE0339426.1 ABC transporter ATP-binding protein [Caldilineaceae bacterium]